MVTISLEEVVKETIENLKKGKVDKRVITFTDFKSQYGILTPSINVEIKLPQGIAATIDVSDYFTKELEK